MAIGLKTTMIFPTRDSIKSYFTIICFIAVSFMIGYWFYKYGIEDRDVGVVDYVQIEDAMDIPIPVVSLCFEDIIVDGRLNDVNKTDYIEYLKGNSFERGYEKIDYKNVTLNLNDYLMYTELIWRNGTIRNNSILFQHKRSIQRTLLRRIPEMFPLK